MSQTPPPDVDVLPPAPSTSSPSTFSALMDALLAALPNFRTQLIALATNGYNNAVDAYNNAVSALNSANTATTQAAAAGVHAANAQTAANNASIAANAPLWVADTVYAPGYAVTSPDTGLSYRRKIAGSGTTDPSIDTANWRPIVLDVITNLPTIRPSLLLDFANSERIDRRITFTRSSNASMTNKNGLIENVGINVPRIYFDPITGECKGLLIEESRTNLLTYSEQINHANWSKTRLSIVSDATVAPDGTMTADKLVVDSTASADHYISQPFTSVAGQYYTALVHIKPAEYNGIVVWFPAAYFDDNSLRAAVINTTTGASSILSGTNISTTVPQLKNGWYKFTVTVLIDKAITSSFILMLANNNSQAITGDGTSGVYLWGAQLEVGSFPTSYISTTGTSVTRAADVAFISGSDFSNWYRQDEGTLVCQSTVEAIAASDSVVECNIANLVLDSNNQFSIRNYQLNGNAIFDAYGAYGGITQFDFGGITTTQIGYRVKQGLAYKTNNISYVTDGGTVETDTTATIPTFTFLRIGGNGANCIASIIYYPKIFTHAVLKGLAQ